MNFPATLLRDNFSPILQCSSCCNFRLLHSFKASSIVSIRKCSLRSSLKTNSVSRLAFQGKQRIVVCRATDTEAEPERDNDKEKEILEDGNITPNSDSPVQNNGELNPQPAVIDQGKEILEDGNLTPSLDSVGQNNGQLNSQPADTDQDNDKSVGMDNDKSLGTGLLDLDNSTKNSDGELKPQEDIQENSEVASGSPLPGLKQLGEPIRIPKETIDVLKDQVFGFDTFFVTSQEPYEGGVLFKGNLRGKAAKSFEKIKKRLEAKFEDQYLVFLLTNPEDDKPVAVVVPKRTLEPEKTAIPEWVAAGTFGVVTIFTLLLRNVPELQSTLLSSFDNIGLLKDGLSGALVTALILGVHELGHNLVARSSGIKLAVPYFVPSWQIGSFGAITRIINIVPNREDLLKFAAAGPVAGFSLGFILLLLGFFIPPSDGIGVVVDSSVFHESFLVGGIAKLLLGDVLKEGSPVSVNPLVIWAWAGLLINAINSIPAGELDGGRIALALWGRKASARLTSAAIVLLGLSSLFNDVAFYWVVLIFFLQRGPIAPLSEEITDPDNNYVALGVTVLILGLLVFLPYPFPFTNEAMMSSF